MEYNLLNLLSTYGLIEESMETFDFSGLTDEQLDALADKAEMDENYYKAFMIKREIEWRKLSPEEQDKATDMSNGFSLDFNGYVNGQDAANGYFFTDRPATKSTFSAKALDVDSVADAYVNKLKQFYPDTWREVIENDLAAAMQDEYKDAMLSRISAEQPV
jgi:hypothetical protein